MKELSRRRFAFPWWAPRLVSWWVYVVLVVAGAVSMVTALWDGIREFPGVWITALVMSVPLLVVWWWLLRIPQLWMRIRTSGAVAAMLWGGFVGAGLYALPANGALMTVLGQHLGVNAAHAWSAALAAPLTEETGKAFVIAAMVLVCREKLRTPMDGAILAGFAGLGFTITEDLLYGFNLAYLSFGENPVVSTLITYLLRAVIFGTVSHVIFSAVVGAGVASIVTRRTRTAVVWGVGLLLLGPLLHFLWNSPVLGPLWAKALYIVLMPAVAWVVIHGIRRAEYRWFRTTLQAPGALGRVPVAYVDAVGATWVKRRRYRRTVMRQWGPRARSAQRLLEAELTDLADALSVGDDAAADQFRARLEARLVAPAAASSVTDLPAGASSATEPPAAASSTPGA